MGRDRKGEWSWRFLWGRLRLKVLIVESVLIRRTSIDSYIDYL